MTDPLQPTVFIVDDDERMRRFCEVVLQHEGLHCEQYSSAKQFLERYESERPGCVLLDIRMPEMTGLELQEELNRRGAVIPVVFATGSAEVPVVVTAMMHGAFDYLQKPIMPAMLVAHVQRALSSDAELRARLKERSQIEERFAQLTDRERDVLDLVINGSSNKQTASRLHLSTRTIEIHRANLLKKTGARNTAHLIRMAMELQKQARAAE